jgi:hypothetical protein
VLVHDPQALRQQPKASAWAQFSRSHALRQGETLAVVGREQDGLDRSRRRRVQVPIATRLRYAQGVPGVRLGAPREIFRRPPEPGSKVPIEYD